MQRGNGAVIGKQNTPTTSVATGVWALNEVQRAVLNGTWPAAAVSDPYFENVTMLLHGDGTNGAQNNTFLDSSTNNFTITRNGNTTQGTFAPYGSNWSNYFDGNGDYLTCSASVPATGAFTVEMWVYPQSSGGYQLLFSQYTSGNAGSLQILWDDTNDKFTVNIGFGTVLTSSSTYSTNAWYHLAIVRDGSNNMTMWVNGVSAATTTNSTSILQTTTYIASRSALDGYFNGYISNLRVTNTAVYTATFTPSTSPLTAISGTSLLTCQSNRFIDNSSNNFTITRNGDVSVQRFSPFNPTAPYAAGTDGGSGYFDGSGDYLTFPNNTAFAFGTGAFTIEFWVNSNGLSDSFILSGRASIGTMHITYGGFGGSTAGSLRYVGSSTITSGSVLISNSQWNHCAIVRDGSNNITLYVNGVSVGTGTDSTNYNTTTGTWYINANDSGPAAAGAGYISNLRIIKGTAVYTSTFTPPTAPLTAITNTSLLCNFTNAGIIDNAEMNNLETVGNAQISTAQSKFGGASMYFDGTGDWLVMPSSPNLAFGTGNFTVEFWINSTSFASTPIYLDFRNTNGSASGLVFYVTTGGAPVVFISSAIITGSSTMSTATFYHIAVVRSGSTITCYLNGTSVGSASNSTNLSDSKLTIGSAVSNTNLVTGYIDDLRITKGYARYTANFTAPTAPFPDF